MDITSAPNAHSRVKGNELAKGYYPTFPGDVELVKSTLKINFGWDQKSIEEKKVCIFDPCAGEGTFLNSVVRHARKASDATQVKNTSVNSYAIELDSDRFKKIRGADQKLNTSFFEVESSGAFDLVLLNPPYNRNTGELALWVDKAAPLVSQRGIMVLIIPEYELKGKMLELLRGNFSYRYAFHSEEYDAFQQVVIFLKKDSSNDPSIYRSQHYHHYDNLENTREDPILRYRDKPLTLDIDVRHNKKGRPLLQSMDLNGFYSDCEMRLEQAARLVLDKQYPSSYDASIMPASTLRTAHAVQLAAMNSQVESVRINGTHYLAKYMVVQKAETYDAYDDGIKTQTIVYKPTVETFLMDRTGGVNPARELGFDYVDLSSQLSTILLRKLTKMYKPLHEIGRDNEYLADALKDIGLKAPQREAVKTVMKAFASGRRGIGIRANTGTGKTWMAKAVKYVAGAKRSIMVTEPQLVPQMVKEYESEGFAVHVIDSWSRLRELAATRPKGLYIISYTRLRMHPDFVAVTKLARVRTRDGIKYTQACVSCGCPTDKFRKGDKESCVQCGSALYTYIPENKRPPMSFRRWIQDMEQRGKSIEVRTHNKQLPYIRYLKRIHFDLAIFDEAHNAANLMSNQGTAFIRLAASAKRVLCMTATVTNGMAKSLYNLLWGINPVQMREAGWDMKSATDFQAKFGAFKEVRKTDERNRHRDSERVTTYDTAGISPAALIYTLPNFVNVDSEDFDDLPPVEREVIKCAPHADVEDCMRIINKIIDDAELPPEDKLPAASVRTAAFLRVSDTFRHADDEICLRNYLLGTLRRKNISELLEKEERLVEIIQGVINRGERILIYTGNTQKIDMRGPLKGIISRNVPGVAVEALPDSVAPEKLVHWFETTTAQVIIASFHRVATGLNLSQFNNLVWFDYTDNTRMAEQGEGRIRRVNTADIHRAIFGSVRPVRYWYLTSSPIQEAQLAYTLEKRMIAKLAEGETPDIDPAECTSGNQSFSALITKALKEGDFDYQDPSALLKKMTKAENARVRGENKAGPATRTNIIQLSTIRPESAPIPPSIAVIHREGGKEVTRDLPFGMYQTLLDAGDLEVTLFGIYVRNPAPGRRYA
jgi:superfamily II DNA or RNA helicase/tRNA1(Val) A37 N6-methylase TrmN6